jgi:hypothetical protein
VVRLRSRRPPQRRQHPDPLSERETRKARVTDPARAFLTAVRAVRRHRATWARPANHRRRGSRPRRVGSISASRSSGSSARTRRIFRRSPRCIATTSAVHRDGLTPQPGARAPQSPRVSRPAQSHRTTPSSAPRATRRTSRRAGRSLLPSEEKQASHSAASRLSLRTNRGSGGGAGPYVVCATAMRQKEQRASEPRTQALPPPVPRAGSNWTRMFSTSCPTSSSTVRSGRGSVISAGEEDLGDEGRVQSLGPVDRSGEQQVGLLRGPPVQRPPVRSATGSTRSCLETPRRTASP